MEIYKKELIIAIDFDGTCVEHKYPEIGREAPYCIDTLKFLASEGHKLILFTMRSGYELGEAINWFKITEIPLWGVQYNPEQAKWSQSNKCYAHLYIDDAALGAPLILPEGFIKPCIDWLVVKKLLTK